ncbi:equilibrative nucleoside transporter 2 [Planococcus citri]|uniref:equilibrative nucleoside transporter 2 n=1 Tax=Planococcus citri TaxID=170843 RepID=UPI0031F9C5B5
MTTKLISPVLYDDYEPEMFISETTVHQEKEDGVEQHEEKSPPADLYGIVNIVFYLLGTSILLPWFFFVTCNDYWMYRFRDLHNHSSSLQYVFELNDNESNRTSLQADFTSYISIASTVPSTLFLFVNIFYLKKFSIHWLIVISSLIVLVLFVETTILVLFDSDSWQTLFFIITVTTVVILNLSTAVLQASLSALFIKFPTAYISAATSGQSLAGIFAAVAQITVLLINASPTKSTFLYFVFADITILLSLLGYLYIRKTDFFQYYARDNALQRIDSHPQLSGSSSPIQYRSFYDSELSLTVFVNTPILPVNYFSIFKKTWILTLSILCCYVVTCSVYPAIAVLVCSEYMTMKSPWADKYFVPVITYLLYCTCEYSGRFLAGYVQKPKGIFLVCLSFIRLIFVPLLMFCNAQPRHHLPVLIQSDLVYAFIIVIFAMSNGYISTLTFILLPSSVMVHEQEVASTMLITSLACGLSIGSLLSFPLINLL